MDCVRIIGKWRDYDDKSPHLPPDKVVKVAAMLKSLWQAIVARDAAAISHRSSSPEALRKDTLLSALGSLKPLPTMVKRVPPTTEPSAGVEDMIQFCAPPKVIPTSDSFVRLGSRHFWDPTRVPFWYNSCFACFCFNYSWLMNCIFRLLIDFLFLIVLSANSWH